SCVSAGAPARSPLEPPPPEEPRSPNEPPPPGEPRSPDEPRGRGFPAGAGNRPDRTALRTSRRSAMIVPTAPGWYQGPCASEPVTRTSSAPCSTTSGTHITG